MNEAPVLDEAALGELVDAIGAAAVRDVIRLFLDECRDTAAALVAPETTPERARRLAHSLKSSAGQLGAAALAAAAVAVETAADRDSTGLPRLVATLVDRAAQTEAVLRTHLQ